MKYSPFLSCLFLVSLYSCSKGYESEHKNKDHISYSDITPAKSLQSVESYIPVVSCGYRPFPNDSSAFYELDIDNDSIADFKIITYHHPKGYCGKCPNYDYNIVIKGLNPGDSIAQNSYQYSHPALKIFQASDIISGQESWNDMAFIDFEIHSDCIHLQFGFSDGYIGLKKGNNYGYIQIKKPESSNPPANNNEIIILSYGFNRTMNNPIKAGQAK